MSATDSKTKIACVAVVVNITIAIVTISSKIDMPTAPAKDLMRVFSALAYANLVSLSNFE